MTDIETIYQFLRSTDGVNQLQRSLPALDPGYIRPDERNKSDLIGFLMALSRQIRFYDLNNLPLGDWQPFFDALAPNGQRWSEAELDAALATRRDWPPHLALLLAFLKAFALIQDDFNTLTSRHLRYFYETALQLQRRQATPDQVHLIFEPAKNAAATLLPAGTLLDAGKTDGGAARQYSLDSEMVVNQALVDGLKSVFVDYNSNGKAIVFKSEDATLVTSDSGVSWRPFGKRQLTLSPESRNMDAAWLGFALASPALLLAEGERHVTLTLTLQTSMDPPPASQPLSSNLIVDLTGEAEWVLPGAVDAELTSPDTLRIALHLPEALPPIVAYQEKIHQAGIATIWPVLRVRVKPEAYQLETLGAFLVLRADLAVEVQGVKNLILQNDQGVQAPGNPALPFGAQPVNGANFYIGSNEAFGKSLTGLSVQLEWQDPPPDFSEHYMAYGSSGIANSVFTTDMYLLAARNWNTLLLFKQSLFNSTDPLTAQTLTVLPNVFQDKTNGSGFGRRPGTPPFTAFETGLVQGFIKMTLTGPTRADLATLPHYPPFEAFGHKAFPSAYALQAIALSKFTGTLDPPELPQQPYTPALKSVSLTYTAQETFKPDSPNGIDQFFVLDVFGPVEARQSARARLTPELPGNGALYIGLKQALAPQLASLLFQVSTGSTPGETLLRSTDLHWSYLAGDNWQALSPQDVVEERTNGLQQPGLIRINLGADASTGNTSMPAGRHWLRVAVDSLPDGAGALEAVLAQGARATLAIDPGQETAFTEHLSQALAAQTIAKLSVKNPAIKKVRQDYPSFGGLPPETDASYFQRISERLRHKNRSVSSWDYERLVLGNFPQVFKIKCLPHTDAANQIAPGNVRLIAVPDFRKLPAGDPLQPRCNAALLRDIEDFIARHFNSPFAAVRITNPAYETLLIDCKVAFRSGFDPGYYSAVLNDELKRFLSPWAYEEGKDIIFGGKIYRTELLAFVEGREYVEYVVDFQLYHRFEGTAPGGISQMKIGLDFVVALSPKPTVGTNGSVIGVDFVVGEPVEIAAATRPDTILVSDRSHRIQALQADDFMCSGVNAIGIGQMIIGIDFVPIS